MTSNATAQQPSPFKDRNFVMLYFGQMISMFGDCFKTVVLIAITYSLYPSASAVGGMFIATVLPVLFGGIIMGPLVDNWNKKHLMIWLDIFRVFCTLGVVWGVTIGNLWVIYAFLALSSFFSSAFAPARATIIPELLKEKNIVQATASFALMTSMAMVLASAAGGFLADQIGAVTILYLDALSFLVSAVFIALIRYQRPERKEGAPRVPYLQQVKEGIDFVKSKPQLRSVYGLQFWRDFCLGYVYILFALYILNDLKGGNFEIGVGYSMTAVAYLIGAAWIKRYFKTNPFGDGALTKIYFPFNILYGIGLGLMFNIQDWYLFLFVLVVANIFQSGVNVITETSLLTYSTPEIRGRVYASWMSMSRLAYGIALPLFSVIGNQIPSGIGGALLTAIIVLSSIYLTIRLKGKLRTAEGELQQTQSM